MVDWSSLPPEVLSHIADCLLATNDVDCYIFFRAVCTSWRSATDDPASSDHSDIRFHPRRWIILDEVFQTDARLMINTTTGRVLRKDLPVLRKYEVTATTPCGFLVLTDKEHPHAARVLNPFTGRMIRFKAQMPFEMGVSAAAIDGDSSPELLLFSGRWYEQYTAEEDSDGFLLNEMEFIFVWLRVAVGAGICTNGQKGVVTPLPFDFPPKLSLVLSRFAIDPSKLFSEHPATGRFADLPGTGHANHCFVVESAGELLVVVMQEGRLKVFYMDTDDDELEPVKSISGRAIFVGYRRCLSVVNAQKFPSIVPNCVYYVKSTDSSLDIYKHGLHDGKEERVSEAIDSLKPSTLSLANPPFTIVQLLSSHTINGRESQLAVERHERFMKNLRTSSKLSVISTSKMLHIYVLFCLTIYTKLYRFCA
ncbi:hypothetical protein VPH35_126180 [Triticum aestivum]